MVQVVYVSAAFLITLLALNHYKARVREEQQYEVVRWLKDIGLGRYKKEILQNGCLDLVECASLHVINGLQHEHHDSYQQKYVQLSRLPSHVRHTLSKAVAELREHLVLRQWLKTHSLDGAEQRFLKLGITSLEKAQKFYIEDYVKLQGGLGVAFWSKWLKAASTIPSSEEELDELKNVHWNKALQEQKKPWKFGAILGLSVIVAVLVGIGSLLPKNILIFNHSNVRKLGLLTYLTGKYLATQNCEVQFGWLDPQVVGGTVSFSIKFFQRNGHPYPVTAKDNVSVEITHGNHRIACNVEIGSVHCTSTNKVQVHFSVRRAGEYCIAVLVGTLHIRGSPFVKIFLPGNPDPQKTCFVHHCSTVVCTESVPHHLFLEPRDEYNNHCSIKSDFDPSSDYSIDILEVTTKRPVALPLKWECHSQSSRVSLVLKFEKEGCYRALVSYKGSSISNGDFHIIVLNRTDAVVVQKNVAKKCHNIWYEARLVSLNGERFQKPKKVFCYVSPKQLIVKEFLLRIIPKRLITFRLCPSTKFQFQSVNNQQGEQVLVIDDGCQPPVELISQERDLLAATFTQFLLKNIGGSETFKDKQEFFYHEVRKFHQRNFHDKISLRITREKLLESSMKCTKGFGVSDWCKNFEVAFVGEQGLDYGGLRREWFELICSSLFDAENQFFCRFKNDNQGLVHPNPKRSPDLKLKHYEFAGKIVGKCLYESALGSSYRQLVKARFSRSFLAQLIGLRVHYKYFEQDDPDLYVSKIKYILENDVDDMELYFIEEEYSSTGQLVKVIELIPGGSHIPVNNQNKLQYLDSLAQYRLANSVKEEVDHFLKGLNDLIPDNLLCIFDENELELLMCGTGQYSIADFKANHIVSGFSFEFQKILDWFWTAVSNFTGEEIARLLQFTTGCSQLPPGGFSELNPKFHITSAPTFGNLPTAHTCFNQLCIPDYDSYEQLERALRLAINEGSEGFGMI